MSYNRLGMSSVPFAYSGGRQLSVGDQKLQAVNVWAVVSGSLHHYTLVAPTLNRTPLRSAQSHS